MEDFKVKSIEENKSTDDTGEEIKVYSIVLEKEIMPPNASYDTNPIGSITIRANSKKDAEEKAYSYIESILKN